MWCPLEHTTTATPRRAAWWSVAQLAMRAACAACSMRGPGAGSRRSGLGAWKHGGAGGQTKRLRGVAGRLPMEVPAAEREGGLPLRQNERRLTHSPREGDPDPGQPHGPRARGAAAAAGAQIHMPHRSCVAFTEFCSFVLCVCGTVSTLYVGSQLTQLAGRRGVEARGGGGRRPRPSVIDRPRRRPRRATRASRAPSLPACTAGSLVCTHSSLTCIRPPRASCPQRKVVTVARLDCGRQYSVHNYLAGLRQHARLQCCCDPTATTEGL